MSQQALTQVLRQLPQYRNRNVLVGSATADDAGVFRLDRDRALVQTTDFFTPIVDDPFAYGQIAAANALSDVFAMGGRPLTALNIMGVPADLVSGKRSPPFCAAAWKRRTKSAAPLLADIPSATRSRFTGWR